MMLVWITCPAAQFLEVGERHELLALGVGGRTYMFPTSDRLELPDEDGAGEGPTSPIGRETVSPCWVPVFTSPASLSEVTAAAAAPSVDRALGIGPPGGAAVVVHGVEST